MQVHQTLKKKQKKKTTATTDTDASTTLIHINNLVLISVNYSVYIWLCMGPSIMKHYCAKPSARCTSFSSKAEAMQLAVLCMLCMQMH